MSIGGFSFFCHEVLAWWFIRFSVIIIQSNWNDSKEGECFSIQHLLMVEIMKAKPIIGFQKHMIFRDKRAFKS